jgi:hypothetical protein
MAGRRETTCAGEHGRDVGDLDGSNRAYQRIRRLYRPFVNQYVAVSRDIEQCLHISVKGASLLQWCGYESVCTSC